MYHMSEMYFAEPPAQLSWIGQSIVQTLLFFFNIHSLLISKNDYVSHLAMKTINETI